MKKKIHKLLLCCTVITLLLAAGCSKERRVQFAHLKGSLAWKQGDWNSAVLSFCEAEDELSAEGSDSDTKTAQYIDFALASAYIMQGEDKAAHGKLQHISDDAVEALQSQGFYQQGIIAFREKKYADAAAAFRKSLELNGADRDAKINYEISKKLSDKQREMQYQAPQSMVEEPDAHAADSIILDIIRKREYAEWKKAQQEADPAVNDY